MSAFFTLAAFVECFIAHKDHIKKIQNFQKAVCWMIINRSRVQIDKPVIIQ